MLDTDGVRLTACGYKLRDRRAMILQHPTPWLPCTRAACSVSSLWARHDHGTPHGPTISVYIRNAFKTPSTEAVPLNVRHSPAIVHGRLVFGNWPVAVVVVGPGVCLAMSPLFFTLSLMSVSRRLMLCVLSLFLIGIFSLCHIFYPYPHSLTLSLVYRLTQRLHIHSLALSTVSFSHTHHMYLQAPVLVTLILGVVVYALFLLWEAKVARFPIVPGTTDPLLDKCYGLFNMMQYSSSGIRPSSAFSLLHS